MYGLVIKAAQDSITKDYGEDNWLTIKNKAKIEDIIFVRTKLYPDKIIYDIIDCAAEHLKTERDTILENLGIYLVEFTLGKNYSLLLNLAGKTFPDFLRNLNNMHARLAQTFKETRAPSFVCQEIEGNTILLDYHSHRSGFAYLIRGLLLGLGKRFDLSLEISHSEINIENENSYQFQIIYS